MIHISLKTIKRLTRFKRGPRNEFFVIVQNGRRKIIHLSPSIIDYLGLEHGKYYKVLADEDKKICRLEPYNGKVVEEDGAIVYLKKCGPPTPHGNDRLGVFSSELMDILNWRGGKWRAQAVLDPMGGITFSYITREKRKETDSNDERDSKSRNRQTPGTPAK